MVAYVLAKDSVYQEWSDSELTIVYFGWEIMYY
jgi:hypothetical protein